MVIDKDEILNLLESVKDPEIPALSVIDMGIIRDVIVDGDQIIIKITPTYSGCPAMFQIRKDVVRKLRDEGLKNVKVETQLSPPWTTDWLSDEAKEKLKASGIAPPEDKAGDDIMKVLQPRSSVHCPFCNSEKTELRSEFSATSCKSLYFCNNCDQPFEHFKCH